MSDVKESPVSPINDRGPRVVVAVFIMAMAIGYGWLAPAEGQPEMIDHHAFMRAVSLMRDGTDYYSAMDRALRETYGPAESVRAFRLPTLFWFWQLLPSARWIWVTYIALVVATGLILLRLSEYSLSPLIVVIYLLNCANLPIPGGWFIQYTATELWTVPAATGAFLAWRLGRDRSAVALALMAVLIRETAAGLLLGGLVAAYLDGRQIRLWVAAIGIAALALCLHAVCVAPHLVPTGEGRETALLGTGGLVSVLRIAGFGLPGGEAVGPLLWLSTLALMLCRSHWARPGIFYLMLPMAGLLVDRPYWGILVVPFTLTLGCDTVARLLAHVGIRAAIGCPEHLRRFFRRS